MWQLIKQRLRSSTPQADQADIYVVGDIHGRADLLNEVCAKIDSDIATSQASETVEIFLGDYIDRGPESAKVISTLAARRHGRSMICLRGNHETIMLEFLSKPDVLTSWRRFGALPTLISYGLSPSPNPGAAECNELSEALARAIPPDDLSFLHSMPTCFSRGRYFFAHAGIRPGVRLDRQRDVDLLTIRDDFLLSEDDFGQIVVHGHTPVQEPELLFNRINIDTGAYATGRLTCLKIRDRDLKIL